MKRAFLIILIAMVLAGCKNQTPTVDPFFGRTTVPPPATGSIAGRTADPYYPAVPNVQPGPIQANAPYNQGRPASNAPLYSGNSTWTNQATPTNSANTAPGSNWTNPFNSNNSNPGATLTNNQPNAQRYSAPASSALSGPPGTTGTTGASPYPMQAQPQNYPAQGTAPPGYSPQTTPAQPASMPTTIPGSTWPGGNRYTPPGGSLNYQGTSNGLLNTQPASSSPNRVATPFFAGGAPNRTTIPVIDNGPRPLNNNAITANGNNAPIYNPNVNSYQSVSNSQTASPPTSMAGGSVDSPIGQSPAARTQQPPMGNQSTQGNNYLWPASRQSTAPNSVQPQNNSAQPNWRESTSSDSRILDDNIEPVSNIEEKDSK
jgi:hypothetical protein